MIWNMGLGGIAVIIIFILLVSALRVLREYERGVVFTLGRFTNVKGPGLVLVIPGIQQMVRVDLRTIVMDVPSQDVISRDNVSVKVNAVVYFRVIEPEKAIIQVANFYEATSQLVEHFGSMSDPSSWRTAACDRRTSGLCTPQGKSANLPNPP